MPAVIAGDDDIGFSNTTSLIIAASKKLPVQIVSSGVLAGAGDEDAWDGLMIPKGSPIKTEKDLEGKTIAVNNLNNVGPLAINTAMAKAGADYTKVKYLEIPFPEMNAALDKKRVDAIWQVEPGYTGALGAGARALFHPFEATAPNLTVAGYFAEQAVHREEQGRARALPARDQEVAGVLGAAPRGGAQGGRDATPTSRRRCIAKIKLPVFKPDLNEPTIQTTIDLAAKYGYIEDKPSLDDLIAR